MSTPDADRPVDPTTGEHTLSQTQEGLDQYTKSESPHESEVRTHPDDVVGDEGIEPQEPHHPPAGDPVDFLAGPTDADGNLTAEESLADDDLTRSEDSADLPAEPDEPAQAEGLDEPGSDTDPFVIPPPRNL